MSRLRAPSPAVDLPHHHKTCLQSAVRPRYLPCLSPSYARVLSVTARQATSTPLLRFLGLSCNGHKPVTSIEVSHQFPHEAPHQQPSSPAQRSDRMPRQPRPHPRTCHLHLQLQLQPSSSGPTPLAQRAPASLPPHHPITPPPNLPDAVPQKFIHCSPGRTPTPLREPSLRLPMRLPANRGARGDAPPRACPDRCCLHRPQLPPQEVLHRRGVRCTSGRCACPVWSGPQQELSTHVRSQPSTESAAYSRFQSWLGP